MKKLFILTLAFLVLPFAGEAQFKFGIRAGASTSNLDREKIEDFNLEFALEEASYGFHFGIFARFQSSNNFYLQPELLFNSNSVDFEVDQHGDGLIRNVLTEKYQYLDMPLIIGYKIGPLRLEAGPVGHAYLASKTELDEIEGYEQRFNDFTLGYQAGLGLDIWRLLVDVRYDGGFKDFGEHMHIFDHKVDFSQKPSRWVLTVGYAF